MLFTIMDVENSPFRALLLMELEEGKLNLPEHIKYNKE